jgi:hypothetical protein
MAEGKEPPAKIQAERKVQKFPWKIGPRCAGFRTHLLSKSGRYGRFRPYLGPLSVTPWLGLEGYIGITGSEIIFIIGSFPVSSKHFFWGCLQLAGAIHGSPLQERYVL